MTRIEGSVFKCQMTGVEGRESSAVSLTRGKMGRHAWVFFYRGEVPKKFNDRVGTLESRYQVPRFEELCNPGVEL